MLIGLITFLFTGATDYEAGPYYVNIAEGDMNASLCINITDNNKLDNGKIFDLIINTTVLHPEIFSPDPNSTVIILDDECKINITKI